MSEHTKNKNQEACCGPNCCDCCDCCDSKQIAAFLKHVADFFDKK